MKLTKLKKIVEIILILSIIILICMIIWDFLDMKKTENYTTGMVDEINKIIEENINNDTNSLISGSDNDDSTNEANTTVVQTQSKSVSISGVNVFGKIKIDKIGIEYPIIEYTSSAALWKSICKISDNNIDGTGNLCLAGHNMRNLTMFGNLRKLNNGDKIEITDLKGNKYVYEVYDKFYVNSNQVDITDRTSEAIITLITCNDTSDKRLIVRGILTTP